MTFSKLKVIKMVVIGMFDLAGQTDYSALAPKRPPIPEIPNPQSFKTVEEVELWYSNRRQTIDNMWEKYISEREQYWKFLFRAQIGIVITFLTVLAMTTIIALRVR